MIRPYGQRMERAEFMMRSGEEVGAFRTALPRRVHGSSVGRRCSQMILDLPNQVATEA